MTKPDSSDHSLTGRIEALRAEAESMSDQLRRQGGNAVPDLIDKLLSALPSGWQPIATVPDDVMEALFFWPALKLDADGNLTTESAGKEKDLVGRSYRHVPGGAWEDVEPELSANGEHFGDDWEYGEPTHWMPLPAPPKEQP